MMSSCNHEIWGNSILAHSLGPSMKRSPPPHSSVSWFSSGFSWNGTPRFHVFMISLRVFNDFGVGDIHVPFGTFRGHNTPRWSPWFHDFPKGFQWFCKVSGLLTGPSWGGSPVGSVPYSGTPGFHDFPKGFQWFSIGPRERADGSASPRWCPEPYEMIGNPWRNHEMEELHVAYGGHHGAQGGRGGGQPSPPSACHRFMIFLRVFHETWNPGFMFSWFP
jgi:hypothetical protein